MKEGTYIYLSHSGEKDDKTERNGTRLGPISNNNFFHLFVCMLEHDPSDATTKVLADAKSRSTFFKDHKEPEAKRQA